MKLTDTQRVLLSAASQRDDRAIELPANLKGGAAHKVVTKLLSGGLVEEIRARDLLPVWHRDDAEGAFALRITRRGLKAIQGNDTPDAKARDAAGEDHAGRPKPSPTHGKTQSSKPGGRKTSRKTPAKGKTHRPQAESKQATVIAMLSGAKGATIPSIMKATGWQQHSVRGFFAGVVRKKLRLNLVSEKTNGDRAYRIVDRVASPKRKGKSARKAVRPA